MHMLLSFGWRWTIIVLDSDLHPARHAQHEQEFALIMSAQHRQGLALIMSLRNPI